MDPRFPSPRPISRQSCCRRGSRRGAAAPSSLMPILTNGLGEGTDNDAFYVQGTDMRFVDIHFEATDHAFVGFYVNGSADLFERVESEGIGDNSPAGAMNSSMTAARRRALRC